MHPVIFERGAELYGRDVPVVSQSLGMDEATATISDVTGRSVKYAFISDAEVRALPFGWATTAANLYQYFRQSDHYEVRRVCLATA